MPTFALLHPFYHLGSRPQSPGQRLKREQKKFTIKRIYTQIHKNNAREEERACCRWSPGEKAPAPGMPSWHRPPPELMCFIIQQLLTTKYEVVPYVSGSSWTPTGIYLLPQSKQQRHEARSQTAKPRWVWHHFTRPAVPPSEPSPSFATATPPEYSLHSSIAPVFSTLWAERAALI